MSAVPTLIHRIVVVVDKVPSNDVVDVPVAVVVDSVRPRAKQVPTIDDSVVIHVRDAPRSLVDPPVQFPQRDPAIAVAITQRGPNGGGNLRLVDPNVALQDRMRVVE